MATNKGLLRSDLLRELRGSLPTRAIDADAILFVVDGIGRYGYFDAELAALVGDGDTPSPGAPFHAEIFIPHNRVARSIAEGLDGRIPEPCLVIPRGSDRQGVIWQLESFPMKAAGLATGRGVACLLTRSGQQKDGKVDPMLAGEALSQRLERERLETTQAVAVTMRHEINNALTSLIGNAELILRRTETLDPLVISRVEEIARQGRRIQAVLDRLEALTEIRTTTYYGGVQMIELGEDDENSR